MKGIFIIGNNTDIGKTYVSALLFQHIRDSGVNAAYYKPVVSGVTRSKDNSSIIDSDSHYVYQFSGVKESSMNPDDFISYSYENAYSPHLASEIEGNSVDLNTIVNDYNKIASSYDYVVVEGCGGIVCPIKRGYLMQTDIIKALNLNCILVSQSGLGAINSTVLTAEYAKAQGIDIKGIIMNSFESENPIHMDNKNLIEEITGIKVLATVGIGANRIEFLYNNFQLSLDY